MAAGFTLGIATTAGGVAMPGLGLVADSYGLTTSFFCLSGLALASLLCSLKLPRTRIDRKAQSDKTEAQAGRAQAQAEGEAKAEGAANSARDAMSGEG